MLGNRVVKYQLSAVMFERNVKDVEKEFYQCCSIIYTHDSLSEVAMDGSWDSWKRRVQKEALLLIT